MTIYYLGARFSSATNTTLHSFRAANSLENYPLPSLGFHTTIAYSKTPFTYQLQPIPPSSTYFTKEVKLFGTSLVLIYDCPWLQHIHNLTTTNGATWDYPDYTPHITIAENAHNFPHPLNKKIPIKITEIFYKEYSDDD